MNFENLVTNNSKKINNLMLILVMDKTQKIEKIFEIKRGRGMPKEGIVIR